MYEYIITHIFYFVSFLTSNINKNLHYFFCIHETHCYQDVSMMSTSNLKYLLKISKKLIVFLPEF